jgi:hypothetical protein
MVGFLLSGGKSKTTFGGKAADSGGVLQLRACPAPQGSLEITTNCRMIRPRLLDTFAVLQSPPLVYLCMIRPRLLDKFAGSSITTSCIFAHIILLHA